MPQGFVYQIMIFSSWGDSYYVGLNGIEFIGINSHQIKLNSDSKYIWGKYIYIYHIFHCFIWQCWYIYYSDIAAYPESVNILEGIDNDVRTPDKLIDGVNDNDDGQHSWLAPILPGEVSNIYYILFIYQFKNC